MAFSPVSISSLSSQDPYSDYICVKVLFSNHFPLQFLNLYSPPIRSTSSDSRTRTVSPDILPNFPDIFILGDFNAHHPTWDSLIPPNPPGNDLFHWITSSGLEILNDPASPTLIHYSTGSRSSPQIAYPLLKHLHEPAQLLLLSLFNWSWSFHTFPSCWKPTTIIPIHKAGKPTSSPSSFRPIFLTSCISKLFERLILSRLTFTSNRIISSRLARLAFVLVGRLSTKILLCLNQSGTASKRKSLQTEPFWRLLTSPRLLTRSGT